ncbi:hypothetical protein MTO96_007960 [Rhipicephalus appendiculatus]
MARRRNSEILWSLMTRIKSPHSFQVRRFSSSSGTETANGSAGGKSKSSSKKSSSEKSSSSTSKTPSRARLCLIVSAIAPGLTFGVFVVVSNAAAVVSAGAVVPSLLVAAVASLLAGGLDGARNAEESYAQADGLWVTPRRVRPAIPWHNALRQECVSLRVKG